MCFYFWIHHQSKNGVAVHIQGIFQWGFMVNPTDRGRVLLRSPIAFVPQQSPAFQWRTCLISLTSGFIAGIAVVLAWIFSLE